MENSKNKFQTKSLKQILSQILEQKPLEKGVQNVRICNSWAEVMGSNINQYTEQVRYSHKTLYISLRSAPLKMELRYKVDIIKDRLNDYLGKKHIQKVIFY